MNSAYIHLVLNHIPVLGTGVGILLLSYGILMKKEEAKWLGLVSFLLCGLVAIPVFMTGEPAEGIVEQHPGISKAAIELHEDSANAALISIELLAAVSLISLFVFHRIKRYPRWAMLVIVTIAFVTSVMVARTAQLGGKIHHTEIVGTQTTAGTELEED